jgi:hypothetical protein
MLVVFFVIVVVVVFFLFVVDTVVVVELVLEGALRAVHHYQERETRLSGFSSPTRM